MVLGWFFVTELICFAVRTHGIPMGARYAPAPPGMRPPCAAKRATFCEEVDKYPTKLIQTLLQSKPLNIASFFTDESDGLDEPPDYLLHHDMLMDLEPKNASEMRREKRSS
ncbi:protein spaetzle 5-like, partial [Uloborus diversus]|uniref:protein spaetzle 5-like n=1 Tax=Uloborus diversus TaxID=327109 RepID=UPI00240A5F0B